MVLYMIGIGLNDEEDITVKGLELVRKADFVYLESYTSKLDCSVKDLGKLYKKSVLLADRDLVEKKSDEILDKAKNKKVAFLVVGDVFSATTHLDLMLRAKEKKIKVEIVNNASILTAVGITGLELYKFGKTTSMPYFEKSFKAEAPYDVIKENKKLGLHTLILLDIKADEKRFMTVNEALKQLLEIESKRKGNVLTQNTKVIGCARLGAKQKIRYDAVKKIVKVSFGKPLHCLIVPGKLHFIEEEALKLYS